MWLRNVMCKEEDRSNVGLGEKMAPLCQTDEGHLGVGCMPEQMRWEIIVLLPKGNDDYHGIGLLDPFWKVGEKIMVA